MTPLPLSLAERPAARWRGVELSQRRATSFWRAVRVVLAHQRCCRRRQATVSAGVGSQTGLSASLNAAEPCLPYAQSSMP